jgi:hypothetical protein
VRLLLASLLTNLLTQWLATVVCSEGNHHISTTNWALVADGGATMLQWGYEIPIGVSDDVVYARDEVVSTRRRMGQGNQLAATTTCAAGGS